MSDKAVHAAVEQRGITEVVHFTTNNGLVGILRTGRLSANAFLKDEERLAHILKINSPNRNRDANWLGYVNLSISEINDYYFNYSKTKNTNNRHAYWCLLSFDANVISDPGVYFSTTNNAYPFTSRARGIDGLNALFQPEIKRMGTWTATRTGEHGAHQPTCRQAEALYPGHLPLAHLRAIYVEDGPVYDEVAAQVQFLAPTLFNNIDIVIDPGRFK